MTQIRNTVVIVDPYRSGSHLADMAIRAGYRCVGVESDYPIPEYLKLSSGARRQLPLCIGANYVRASDVAPNR